MQNTTQCSHSRFSHAEPAITQEGIAVLAAATGSGRVPLRERTQQARPPTQQQGWWNRRTVPATRLEVPPRQAPPAGSQQPPLGGLLVRAQDRAEQQTSGLRPLSSAQRNSSPAASRPRSQLAAVSASMSALAVGTGSPTASVQLRQQHHVSSGAQPADPHNPHPPHQSHSHHHHSSHPVPAPQPPDAYDQVSADCEDDEDVEQQHQPTNGNGPLARRSSRLAELPSHHSDDIRSSYVSFQPENTPVRAIYSEYGICGLAVCDLSIVGGILPNKVRNFVTNLVRRYSRGMSVDAFTDQPWLARHGVGTGGPHPDLVVATASCALDMFRNYNQNPQKKKKKKAAYVGVPFGGAR